MESEVEMNSELPAPDAACKVRAESVAELFDRFPMSGRFGCQGNRAGKDSRGNGNRRGQEVTSFRLKQRSKQLFGFAISGAGLSSFDR